MMASAKRKQDEKNLKILRELVSQPGNKECFDCNQRGPTYVNMTIGSFVCTSCSGILRGLTPPHRVKSISMATFTQEEIDFIKEHGNEHCRRIWLGLMNPNANQSLDTKDEQKMKDLMSAKYELKRYYLEPSVASQNSNQKLQSPNQNNIPRVPHSGTSTTQLSVPLSQKTKNPEPVNVNNFTADFVADFSKVPDPFLTMTPVNKLSQPIIPQPLFANFDNNPIFNNTKGTEMSLSLNTSGGNLQTMNMNGASVPPSEDRYAALKDLDSLMKQTYLKEDTSTATAAATAAAAVAALSASSTWNTNANAANTGIWSGNNHQATNVISNPFASADLWRPSTNLVNNNSSNSSNSSSTSTSSSSSSSSSSNNNNTAPSIDSSLCNSANPFKPVQFPMNNDPQWMGVGSTSNGDVIQFSQLVTPLTNKVWQPTVPAYHANPFMVGSGVSNMTRNSNNPFL